MSNPHDPSAVANLAGADLDALTRIVKREFDVRDRTYGFPAKRYERCFVGSEAVERMIAANVAADSNDAERIGNLLLQAGVFQIGRAHV